MQKLLDEYGIQSSVKYPTDGEILTTDTSKSCDQNEYLKLVMKLMYAATRTRPDVLYHTATLATRSSNPTEKDMDSLFTMLKYLHGTKEFGLVYKRSGELTLGCYIDASFNCHHDAKGHTGFVIFPDKTGSSGVIYKSIKQKRVADSSAEAELMALHESVQYLVYISGLYEELGYLQQKIPVYQDNQATIQMASSESIIFKGKSKFINRKYFGIYQYVEDGTIQLIYVDTDRNVSDYLTKALFGNKFLRFRVDIMGSVEDIIRGEEHRIRSL